MTYLNPWEIEVVFCEECRIRINLVDRNCGEVRQLTLTLEELNEIYHKQAIGEDDVLVKEES